MYKNLAKLAKLSGKNPPSTRNYSWFIFLFCVFIFSLLLRVLQMCPLKSSLHEIIFNSNLKNLIYRTFNYFITTTVQVEEMTVNVFRNKQHTKHVTKTLFSILKARNIVFRISNINIIHHFRKHIRTYSKKQENMVGKEEERDDYLVLIF